jgi:hypothetical protein
MRRRLRTGWIVLIPLLAATALLPGCHTVDYYEQGQLLDPLMQFDADPGEAHWEQKVSYAREGSAGGVGTTSGGGSTAGGGCGCY